MDIVAEEEGDLPVQGNCKEGGATDMELLRALL